MSVSKSHTNNFIFNNRITGVIKDLEWLDNNFNFVYGWDIGTNLHNLIELQEKCAKLSNKLAQDIKQHQILKEKQDLRRKVIK